MATRVTVMGSFVVDLMARAPHLPRTGETVKGNGFRVGPGGKGANQAVAARRAGAEVDIITKLGTDDFSHIALDSFRGEGMHVDFVSQDPNLATGAALIMVDEATGDNKIVVAPGACSHITRADLERARSAIEGSAVLLTQLETNLDATETAVEIAAAAGVTVILNPAPAAPIADELLARVDILTPNETEAAALSGLPVTGPEDAGAAARALMARGARNVMVTLGSRGVLVVTADEERFIPSYPVDCVDATGAGDAFSGALATAVAEGRDVFTAAEFANVAAALSVTKLGTAPAMPYRKEIEEAMRARDRA
ncbi:MAG: ribokinase [Candidatus Geothermincolia bacterium]